MVDTADMVKEGLNVENSELDLREKELKDADIVEIMKSDEVKSITALFLEFNEIEIGRASCRERVYAPV